MSDWYLIEHKGVCCFIFLWAIGLKMHSIVYKMFLNESFDEYLSYLDNFVKSYCMFNSKLVWSRGTILSEDGLASSNLWRGFASSIFEQP